MTRTYRLLAAVGATLAVLPGPGRAQDSDGWRTDFSRYSVPLNEIVAGGPPRDGIPAVDQPRFGTVREADRWLADREPVVVVVLGGEARGYPLQILIWHEIVNDVIADHPVVVTYCPLCNTALAFDRRVGDRVLDFGTTGRLRHSDLVMYDRQTESWWQQATGEAIVGSLVPRRLRPIPAPIMSWRALKTAYPTARVLTRETGHERPYGRNPYLRYDARRAPLLGFFTGAPDDRLPAMERVVALELDGEAVAYSFSTARQRRVINDRVGDVPIVVTWTPGTASALDAAEISRGREVGSTMVFDRRVSDRTLTFERAPRGDGMVDRETGTTWDAAGRGLAGTLAGRTLASLPHGNHFWFAWAAFQPATRIVP